MTNDDYFKELILQDMQNGIDKLIDNTILNFENPFATPADVYSYLEQTLKNKGLSMYRGVSEIIDHNQGVIVFEITYNGTVFLVSGDATNGGVTISKLL